MRNNYIIFGCFIIMIFLSGCDNSSLSIAYTCDNNASAIFLDSTTQLNDKVLEMRYDIFINDNRVGYINGSFFPDNGTLYNYTDYPSYSFIDEDITIIASTYDEYDDVYIYNSVNKIHICEGIELINPILREVPKGIEYKIWDDEQYMFMNPDNETGVYNIRSRNFDDYILEVELKGNEDNVGYEWLVCEYSPHIQINDIPRIYLTDVSDSIELDIFIEENNGTINCKFIDWEVTTDNIEIYTDNTWFIYDEFYDDNYGQENIEFNINVEVI